MPSGVNGVTAILKSPLSRALASLAVIVLSACRRETPSGQRTCRIRAIPWRNVSRRHHVQISSPNLNCCAEVTTTQQFPFSFLSCTRYALQYTLFLSEHESRSRTAVGRNAAPRRGNG